MLNKMAHFIRLLATDLDGTLLKNDQSISMTDLDTLSRLGKQGVVRITATGRSLFKVRDVLPLHAPVDYVVFSSGAGIYDWKNQHLLHRERFSEDTAREIIRHLLGSAFNFFIYHPIPDNNRFFFHRGAKPCNEFEEYLLRHEGDYQELKMSSIPSNAGQMMAIIPNQTALFEALKEEILQACSGVRVIRTTSPVNKHFIWMEIFPDTVSKGHGIRWLCDHLGIAYDHTVGIGNDYNDLDMFEFVAHPFVLANGVEELKCKFREVDASNEHSGLTRVVEQISRLMPDD
ncbi:MAG: HAD family phosphatase [Prolixibacteraceae bacterium]|nr:HAD family phosphatase [Prolixibacteraceae bacterium]